jgi:hypothetical protein
MAKKKQVTEDLPRDVTYEDLIEYLSGNTHIALNCIAEAMEQVGPLGLADDSLWWKTITNIHKIAFELSLRNSRG